MIYLFLSIQMLLAIIINTAHGMENESILPSASDLSRSTDSITIEIPLKKLIDKDNATSLKMMNALEVLDDVTKVRELSEEQKTAMNTVKVLISSPKVRPIDIAAHCLAKIHLYEVELESIISQAEYEDAKIKLKLLLAYA